MERRKLTKEDIDKVRNIEGFPIGTDEDIIALSDAPFYTACPNPFIEDFIKEYGTPYDEATDDYHREPFAADVSEGKNDAFYMAHSYHTKVPHKAIMKYILHYTNPGDIVYDGFSGTGMTGVAAQMCAELDSELQYENKNVKWGGRKAILSDLSPIASFISASYNQHIDVAQFQMQAETILKKAHQKYDWMFKTHHKDSMFAEYSVGHINYIVWSHVALCPHCGDEFVLYNMMWNPETKKMSEKFTCPKCLSTIKKNDCDKSITTEIDELTGELRTKKKPFQCCLTTLLGKKGIKKSLMKTIGLFLKKF